MPFRWHPAEQLLGSRFLLEWAALASVVGVLGGTASALFLVSLEWATDTRLSEPWLVYLLPVGGLLVGVLYHYFGKGVEGGSNLLLDEIHEPRAGVPAKMAPLILLATVATHLFGGSAGREGTAVQMGGSLASWFARAIRSSRFDGRILLMAGISAGFGSVFGTPLAGMVFGLEVLAVGRVRYDALIPCLVASVVGDWTCTAWGVHHTQYVVDWVPVLAPSLIAKILGASLAFALASVLFAELTSALHWAFERLVRWGPARPALGGLALLGLVWLLDGGRDYLGLGVPTIVQSFRPEGVPTWAFAWKIVFTALTLGSGFKGGEVTPLFFIGASLGCTLGHLLGVHPGFMAALGFVAVFAAAANTPLACTIMGMELFGAQHTPYLAMACCFAYVWSGHRGIYSSQVIDTPKTHDPNVRAGGTLHQAREAAPPLSVRLRRLGGLGRWMLRRAAPPAPLKGEPGMQPESRLVTQKMGLVRIHLSHRDKHPGTSWVRRVLSRPLYQEIIDLARDAGLTSATAKGTPYGFSAHGTDIRSGVHPERGIVEVHIYVELMAPREKLEAFLLQIAPLIEHRVVLYEDVEHWTVPVVPIDPATGGADPGAST